MMHNTPQHNGIAKSLNQCILKHICMVLHGSGMPKTLWGKATPFTVWVKNKTTACTLGKVMPYERLYGEKPNLAGLPEWGQCIWVHQMKRPKLDARALEGRWVCYDEDSTHAHHIYWPGKNSISVKHDVTFMPAMTTFTFPSEPSQELTSTPSSCTSSPMPPPNESPPSPLTNLGPGGPHSKPATTTPSRIPVLVMPSAPQHSECIKACTAAIHGDDTSSVPTEMASAEEVGSSEGAQPEGEPHRESSSLIYTNDRNIDYIFHAEFDMAIVMAALEDLKHNPKSLKDVQSHSDWPHWKKVMDVKIATLERTAMWITVPCPPDRNIIGSKWVYCIKCRPEGQIIKYKAHLVMKGYMQIYGINYYNMFSPVM
jgi:hypothetical protein